MNADKLREELEAAKAALAALTIEEADLRREEATIKARLKVIEERRHKLRNVWRPDEGAIPYAESHMRNIEQQLADCDAVHLRITGEDDTWVIVSAGPKQVKIRRFGSRFGRVDIVDRATATQWNREVVGGAEALEAAVAAFKAGGAR